MYIIMLEAYADGGRPGLQTWDYPNLPEGYVWCPQEFYDVFYSTDPAGFVDITVENDTVTAMEVDWDAYNAYVAENPMQEEAEGTEELDVWDALDAAYREGVDSI